MNEKKEEGMVDFLQSPKDVAKIADMYIMETDIQTTRARRITLLFYFGIAFCCFLLFLACV